MRRHCKLRLAVLEKKIIYVAIFVHLTFDD